MYIGIRSLLSGDTFSLDLFYFATLLGSRFKESVIIICTDPDLYLKAINLPDLDPTDLDLCHCFYPLPLATNS
jgi:hypothetical protein